MSEYYVTIDTVEEDGMEWNSLLRLVVAGKEYLISAVTVEKLGKPNDRLWVEWSKLECDTVSTIEENRGVFFVGKVKLCTATDVRENK